MTAAIGIETDRRVATDSAVAAKVGWTWKGAHLLYATFKFVHLLGVVLLVGNVTVTAVWKVFADRTKSPTTVAFAQRLVTYTDWTFTLGGVLLTAAGGYGMAWVAKIDILSTPWLVWGQVLFAASGFIWLGLLVPIQGAQSRPAARFNASASVPDAYRRLGWQWICWGIAATVPLFAAMIVMIAKF